MTTGELYTDQQWSRAVVAVSPLYLRAVELDLLEGWKA